MRIQKTVSFLFALAFAAGAAVAQDASEPKKTMAKSTAKPVAASTAQATAAKPNTIHAALETKMTAAPNALPNPYQEPVVPEGSRLVDGTHKNEFYIVAKNGETPDVETPGMKAEAKALQETEKMVSNLNEPKLDNAINENDAQKKAPLRQAPLQQAGTKPLILPTTPPTSHVLEAENTVTRPAVQLAEGEVTQDVTPSPENVGGTAPAESTGSTEPTEPTEHTIVKPTHHHAHHHAVHHHHAAKKEAGKLKASKKMSKKASKKTKHAKPHTKPKHQAKSHAQSKAQSKKIKSNKKHSHQAKHHAVHKNVSLTKSVSQISYRHQKFQVKELKAED